MCVYPLSAHKHLRQTRTQSGSSLHPTCWPFPSRAHSGCVLSNCVLKQFIRLAEPQLLHLKDRNNSQHCPASSLVGKFTLKTCVLPCLPPVHPSVGFQPAQFSGLHQLGRADHTHLFPTFHSVPSCL